MTADEKSVERSEQIGVGKVPKMFRRLRKRDTNIIVTSPKEQEWQCIECGNVVESVARPQRCSNCNCVNGDHEMPGMNLFARREAVGWFE